MIRMFTLQLVPDIRCTVVFKSGLRYASQLELIQLGLIVMQMIVLRMLSNYVGETAFLEGVSRYLKQRLYGNSVSRDLWDAIGNVTGLEIAKLMDNWIGFPVVSVKERPDGIYVKQSRFWESGPAPNEDSALWMIPLCVSYITDSGDVLVDRTLMLDKRESVLSARQGKFLKLNADTKGVFRVQYERERFLQIAEEIEHNQSKFSLNDKIGLIHDVVALGLAGYEGISVTLAIIYAFRNEKEYLIWGSISAGLNKLISIFWESPKITQLLYDFCKSLYGPIVHKVGISYSPDESLDITILRTNVIEQAALVGHEE
ncbi:hypothetical protein EIP86_003681 [Pleurotus ostreatoroseus]|nr:hypothetical protein EIP86_003681 [Pleurotus ostreatoroseus]